MATSQKSFKKPNFLLRTIFSDKPGSIAFQRFVLDGIAQSLGKTPKTAKVRKGAIGGIRAEFIEGWANPDGRTLLYLHGGAYMMGSIATHRPLASVFSRISQSRGVLIDYRLAPEHPFPAALDDALVSYEALLDSGVNPKKIALAGDSAGGGLVLSLLQAIRQNNLVMPAAAFCMSPWTDLYNCNKSGQYRRTGQRHRQDLFVKYASRLYAGCQDKQNPLISPIFGDYAGLPPLLIHAARGELLRNDARDLAKKAQDQGVDVTLNMYPGKLHVLQGFAGRSELGKSLIMEGGAFLKKHLDNV